MFIYERRRVIRNFQTKYTHQWDRTFYVCTSQRVDGKPKRVVHGWFKNALTWDQAIENQQSAIQAHLKNEGLAQTWGYTKQWKANLESMQDFLELLREWKSALPDWNTEPLGEVPFEKWPKPKPARYKPSKLVERACNLVQQMNREERQAFFYQLRDLEVCDGQ
jgi:hypothetical protein